MGVSKELCLEEVQDSTNLYWQVVVGSLVLTSFNVALYYLFFRRSFEGAPGLASQFFFVTGSIKIVLGVLIVVLFVPACPDRCSCEDMDMPSPAYGLVCTLIGILWLLRGNKFLQKAQALENGESEGGKDTVFEQVSTVEVI
jgi:hypothetical protein